MTAPVLVQLNAVRQRYLKSWYVQRTFQECWISKRNCFY